MGWPFRQVVGATFVSCLAGIASLVLAPTAWANFAPRFKGDATSEPWGLKGVAIPHERLTIDLRPLADGRQIATSDKLNYYVTQFTIRGNNGSELASVEGYNYSGWHDWQVYVNATDKTARGYVVDPRILLIIASEFTAADNEDHSSHHTTHNSGYYPNTHHSYTAPTHRRYTSPTRRSYTSPTRRSYGTSTRRYH